MTDSEKSYPTQSLKLGLIIPTQHYGKWWDNLKSWGVLTPIQVVSDVRPLTAAYQQGFEKAPADWDILGYVHDDVTCYDPDWKARVLAEFEDPQVGLVGFGGTTGHGDAEIYQKPYSFEQVGREGRFMSNMRNAEQHGERMTGSAEAKCLDGFAMFVRRGVLENTKWTVPQGVDGITYNATMIERIKSGWPQNTPIAYWCYDYWLSCETRRQGYRIRVVGVDCEHTCPPEYRSYVVEEDCQAAHRWLYLSYPDTFPARCEVTA